MHKLMHKLMHRSLQQQLSTKKARSAVLSVDERECVLIHARPASSMRSGETCCLGALECAVCPRQESL
jgi:hypothetical protein